VELEDLKIKTRLTNPRTVFFSSKGTTEFLHNRILPHRNIFFHKKKRKNGEKRRKGIGEARLQKDGEVLRLMPR
jgi:hypothetical protein